MVWQSDSQRSRTRREVLSHLSTAAASAVLTLRCQGAASGYAQRWMDTVIGKGKEPEDRTPGGPLWVARFKDPIYFLLRPISWRPNPGQEKLGAVEVPVGFVTDFASIPQPFWSLLRPDGDYAYAAVVHDYLYWTQTRLREECDEILKFAMQDFKVSPPTVETIYRAVSLGGGRAWSQNGKLRANGEKRILKRFPGDPRITWAEWKRRADTFA